MWLNDKLLARRGDCARGILGNRSAWDYRVAKKRRPRSGKVDFAPWDFLGGMRSLAKLGIIEQDRIHKRAMLKAHRTTHALPSPSYSSCSHKPPFVGFPQTRWARREKTKLNQRAFHRADGIFFRHSTSHFANGITTYGCRSESLTTKVARSLR